MSYFFTSSYSLEEGGVNPANGFVEKLKAELGDTAGIAYVCSDPDNYAITELFAKKCSEDFKAAGIRLKPFEIIDRRTQDMARILIEQADLVFLAGGHVPTQNRFFHELGLKEILKNYTGTIIGSSAGSMDAASITYCPPEEDGEAIDRNFAHFLDGLALTETLIMPHWQMYVDMSVDGLNVIDDIVLPDSRKHRILGFPDGTYLEVKDGTEKIFGDYYIVENGVATFVKNS